MSGKDKLRTPLSRVRGLGSAKDGTAHYVAQRLTAIALVPLAVWFVVSLATVIRQDTQFGLHYWLQNPYNALGLLLMMLALCYHARLGVQVVIEDYVHCACGKPLLLMLSHGAFLVAAVASVLAIVKMHVMP